MRGKIITTPQHGEERCKTAFLLLAKALPISNGSKHIQTRWLETTSWAEYYDDYFEVWIATHWTNE